ncbi:MAG TPA: hypothetical protein VFA19_04470 [Gaiellaceae bacterium]|nr:hypothetical protein [Gaiellaceae bacterium]
MSRRMVLAVVAASMTAVPAAHSAGTAATNCGTVTGGGATWSVLAAGGVPCGSARPLIRSLSSKPHPSPATRLGTHLGLKCTEIARGKTREIACISPDGRRSVFGVTPPRK